MTTAEDTGTQRELCDCPPAQLFDSSLTATIQTFKPSATFRTSLPTIGSDYGMRTRVQIFRCALGVRLKSKHNIPHYSRSHKAMASGRTRDGVFKEQ